MHNVRVFVYYLFRIEPHRLKYLETELSTIRGMYDYLLFLLGECGTIQECIMKEL